MQTVVILAEIDKKVNDAEEARTSVVLHRSDRHSREPGKRNKIRYYSKTAKFFGTILTFYRESSSPTHLVIGCSK